MTKTADKATHGKDRVARTNIQPTPKGETPGKAGTSSPGNDKPETHGPIDDVNYQEPQPVDGSYGSSQGNDKVDEKTE